MKQRDNTIDILRGIAIFTMVAANMSAHSYQEPHPYWFRIYGSFAAPTFVFLAGFMVSFTSFLKTIPLSYYLKRGAVIIGVAVLIDVLCWGAVPFATFDVLYVIGLSLPLAKLFLGLKRINAMLLLASLFIAAPILQYCLGYIDTPVEPALSEFSEKGWDGAIVWKQFVVDGWFPVFPWLGVALLGTYIGRFRCESQPEKSNKKFIINGLILLAIGITAWVIINPHLMEREGYSELFYPPTSMFFAVFLGGVFLLLGLLYKVRDSKILWFLSVYGKSSLLMYILHTTFNVYVFNVFFGTYELPLFAALVMAHLAVLWLIAFAVQKLKKDKKLPMVASVILGG